MEVDNRGREYRYQKDWSYGDMMFHVRCDDFEEFKEAVKNMETMLPVDEDEAFPNDTGKMATPPSPVQSTAPICEVHKVAMLPRVGKFGKFWSCGKKNADGTWCKYKYNGPPPA